MTTYKHWRVCHNNQLMPLNMTAKKGMGAFSLDMHTFMTEHKLTEVFIVFMDANTDSDDYSKVTISNDTVKVLKLHLILDN